MRKGKRKQLFGYCLMLVAFLIPLYCFGTIVWQSWTQESRYEHYTEAVDRQEVLEQTQRASAYNERLSGDNTIVDPFLAEGYSVDYDVLSDPDGIYGYLSIPKLGLLEPVYLGADDVHLSKGLAHVDGTQLPLAGEGIRSVIAGHRGWANQVFFRHLDQLEAGDILYFDDGQEITQYQMVASEIILPSEWEKLQPESGKNLLTLLTCDPVFVFNKRLLLHFERKETQVNAQDYPTIEPSKRAQVMATSQTNALSSPKFSPFSLLYHAICGLSLLGVVFVLLRLLKLFLKQKS